ncbi:hypothetical protein FWG95_04155 [Candidatus Saccharibacteria bacterium]|nr:hypothetical protein [Candidatus Saccharibacteria bacterium]
MPNKPIVSRSRTRLIYWLLFAPFVLVPVSVWILDGYGEVYTFVLWLGLSLEIISIIGFFIGLWLLSIQSAHAPTFRSKKFSWPAVLLFLIPLILLAVSSLVFIPNNNLTPLVVTELLLLRTIALASFVIGAILAFKRIKPIKTAWLMVGLSAIPYLLIIIVSFATYGPYGFNTMEEFHQFETRTLTAHLSSVVLGLIVLAFGWFRFRKKV